MREKHTVQRSIFEHYAEHEIGRELKAMSDWLDQRMDLLEQVAADINPCNVEDTGRKGLSVESVLQACISAITDATWERINQRLLFSAQQTRVEKGEMLRIDSTVTDTPIHAPSDSSLLWDSVRVLMRLLRQADMLIRFSSGTTISCV